MDAYVVGLPSLVNKKKKSLWPVVLQRNAMADSFTRRLSLLGLEPTAALVPDLNSYIASKAIEEDPTNE